MSVGSSRDNKMRVISDATKAFVEIFERKPGGLYACKMRLESPFGRQG